MRMDACGGEGDKYNNLARPGWPGGRVWGGDRKNQKKATKKAQLVQGFRPEDIPRPYIFLQLPLSRTISRNF